ncbi:MAG: hypothetical protein BA870_07570 [Desulfuromonadales bacterium C00003094]|nr:MAG: hypothetical protein BA870_07570 [Desulfuromonadales bacterium C00003094]OEU73692.1 MAG: hypothetical protein BA869_06925 [Desulfuromonadales bacterium C00003107]
MRKKLNRLLLAKLAQQLAVVFELAAKNDGATEDVLPMGSGIENGIFRVLAELYPPLQATLLNH